MKPYPLLLAVLLALHYGWQPLRAQEQVLRRTIDHHGAEREYFIHLPAVLDDARTYWLVVAAHGAGGNGETLFLTRGVRAGVDALGLDDRSSRCEPPAFRSRSRTPSPTRRRPARPEWSGSVTLGRRRPSS